MPTHPNVEIVLPNQLTIHEGETIRAILIFSGLPVGWVNWRLYLSGSVREDIHFIDDDIPSPWYHGALHRDQGDPRRQIVPVDIHGSLDFLAEDTERGNLIVWSIDAEIEPNARIELYERGHRAKIPIAVKDVAHQPVGLLIKGDPVTGGFLKINHAAINDLIGDAPRTYVWIKNGDPGRETAHADPIKLWADDRDSTYALAVTYEDESGRLRRIVGEPTEPVRFDNSPATGKPVIVGNPTPGQKLRADVNDIADPDGRSPVIRILWYVDGESVEAGYGFDVRDSHVGKTIQMRASFEDNQLH
ncbi:hypothetical protein [uncultured Jannaschia sp.]|uniref:hypothetical protein n=1 Tax=uncultured Jannaschia sp. TaxID=293347 RepID=UPI002615FBF3|nr:hypothetical protein [uncultured Jannaschia sp.]